MADGHRFAEHHRKSIQAAIDAAAGDGWFLRTDEIDDGIYLAAGEALWAQGQQGPEFMDINIPDEEY